MTHQPKQSYNQSTNSLINSNQQKDYVFTTKHRIITQESIWVITWNVDFEDMRSWGFNPIQQCC
jgi:hypothetical protein